MDLLIAYIAIAWLILLLLIINRQIIWAGLYNTFWPIIMAGLLYSNILSEFSFIILLLSSYIAWEVTRLFIKNIYASQILKNMLYIWITILIFFAVHYIGYQESWKIFSSSELLILLWYIVLFSSLISKLYAYGKWKISINWLLYLLWFFVLSFIIVYIINSERIVNLFDGNMISIFIITVAIIGTGLYDGLQLKEMIRFRKLIRDKWTTNKYQKK